MGIVYEAEQPSPRRRVALKVVRSGTLIDEDRLRMFQREIDTLARLDHPDIGSIYESGRTEDGQHFFAMELVRGRTLAAYLAGRDFSAPGELGHRLLLFRRIANAVHYAHQRGVIHRDLKPSNVIVTEREDSETPATGPPLPGVKVLDFGLARITDADVTATTMVTEVGTIKGTLPYMSPEQARGDPANIDVRSDVYSLGVMLYETVCGSRPYDLSNRSLLEAVKVICETDARPMSTTPAARSRSIDPDVETIATKAMEKDPGRRYASAAELSADIERYLSSQPILARPPTAAYQLRKFAARNRGLVAGLVAAFVVLLVGVVVATTLGLREAAQRREAERARAELQEVADFQSRMLREIDTEGMGRRMVGDLRERVIRAARGGEGLRDSVSGAAGTSTEAGDVAAAAAAARFDALLRRVNTTDAALGVIDRDILGRAARTLDEGFAGGPEVALRLRATVRQTYDELGMLEQARVQAERVLEGNTAHHGPEHRLTLESATVLASLNNRLGDDDKADALAQSTYETALRTLGENDPVTLQARKVIGVLLEDRAQHDKALATLEEVLAAQRAVLGSDHPQTMGTASTLALIYPDVGRGDEGIVLMRELIETARRVHGEESADTLTYSHNLALLYAKTGRYDEAIEEGRALLALSSRVFGDDHPRTLRAKANLAAHYRLASRWDEALALAKEIVNDMRRVRGPEHPETLDAVARLAIIQKNIGHYAEAEALYRQALAGHSRGLGSDPPDALWIRFSLADLYRSEGRLDDAEREYRRTVERSLSTLGPKHRDTLLAQQGLAQLLATCGRPEEAEPIYLAADQAQLELLGSSHPQYLGGVIELVSFYVQQERYDEASKHAERALRFAREALGEENQITISAKNALGYVRQLQQRWEESEHLYRDVLEAQLKTYGRKSPNTAVTLQNLACLYRDSGRYDESRELFVEVVQINDEAFGADNPRVVDNLQDYLKLLRKVGDEAEASAIEERIRTIGG